MPWNDCGPTRSISAARVRADDSHTWVPANAAQKPPISSVVPMSRLAEHAGRREIAAGLVDDTGEDVGGTGVGDRLDADAARGDLGATVDPPELVPRREVEARIEHLADRERLERALDHSVRVEDVAAIDDDRLAVVERDAHHWSAGCRAGDLRHQAEPDAMVREARQHRHRFPDERRDRERPVDRLDEAVAAQAAGRHAVSTTLPTFCRPWM